MCGDAAEEPKGLGGAETSASPQKSGGGCRWGKLRATRRKYFRRGKFSGSPQKSRKDFRWGKLRGPRRKSVWILCGVNFGVPAESIFGGAEWRDTASKSLPQCGHVRFSTLPFAEGAFPCSSSEYCPQERALGSPQQFPQEFCGVDWRSALSAPIFRPLTYGKYAASPEYGGFRASHLNIALRGGRVGGPAENP